MSKPRMDLPLAGGVPPPRFVKVLRARAPAPWIWAIHEEGRAEPVCRSTRSYRCADDAWAVGRAVLGRLPKPSG